MFGTGFAGRSVEEVAGFVPSAGFVADGEGVSVFTGVKVRTCGGLASGLTADCGGSSFFAGPGVARMTVGFSIGGRVAVGSGVSDAGRTDGTSFVAGAAAIVSGFSCALVLGGPAASVGRAAICTAPLLTSCECQPGAPEAPAAVTSRPPIAAIPPSANKSIAFMNASSLSTAPSHPTRATTPARSQSAVVAAPYPSAPRHLAR